MALRKISGEIRQSEAAPTARSTASDSELSPASRPERGTQRPSGMMPSAELRLHGALLSGVAGYVDAAGFASLLGLFPAHITGEIVGDAIALSSGRASAHAHFWIFPVFVGSVVLATLVARVFRHHGFRARAGLLALVTLALALFSVSDALARLLQGQLPLLVRGGFAVAAMGFQSALMRESLTGSCPTTVMTGNLTQVVIDSVDHLVGKVMHPLVPDDRVQPRMSPVASALFMFASSAVLGGWLTRRYGSASVGLPTLLTGVLMVQAWRQDISRPKQRALDTPPPCPLPLALPRNDRAEARHASPSQLEAEVLELGSKDQASATRLRSEPLSVRSPERPRARRRVSGIQRIYTDARSLPRRR